jgi:hypothetical protein
MSARSRSPRGVETSGCAISESTSSTEEVLGQDLPGAGRMQIVGGAGRQPSVDHEEAIETADARHLARHRAR